MGFCYLSNPYNGTEEEREYRAKIAAQICSHLIKQRIFTFSPIVHNHAMMKEAKHFTLKERKTIILDFDFSVLATASAMIALQIEGWDQSYGVQKEIEFCLTRKIPIFYLKPAEILENHPRVADLKVRLEKNEFYLDARTRSASAEPNR